MHRVARGSLEEVAGALRALLDEGKRDPILVFDDATGDLVELDLRGSVAEVRDRYQPLAEPAKRGRPRLGVVAREVTLLPRHWEWLSSQPGGASVALRKLVEEARRVSASRDAARQAQNRTYRFLSHLAGNLPGFEEASRALFAGQAERFLELLAGWPPDVREYAASLLDCPGGHAGENLALQDQEHQQEG